MLSFLWQSDWAETKKWSFLICRSDDFFDFLFNSQVVALSSAVNGTDVSSCHKELVPKIKINKKKNQIVTWNYELYTEGFTPSTALK